MINIILINNAVSICVYLSVVAVTQLVEGVAVVVVEAAVGHVTRVRRQRHYHASGVRRC